MRSLIAEADPCLLKLTDSLIDAEALALAETDWPRLTDAEALTLADTDCLSQ